ncbi:MAG: hypothetical protein FJ267_19205 [Planctomycetes bacterium]|nr:hypothetical protein [Planctomycetota bacterium]
MERFLSFAVTLVVEQSRRCRDGEMSFYGSGVTTIRWRGRGSTASLETLFDEVAVFEAGRAADTMSLVEDALFIATPSTRIVFLTSRPEAGDGSIEGLDSNTRIEVHRFQTIQEIDQFFILEDSYKGALNDRSSQSEFAEVKN